MDETIASEPFEFDGFKWMPAHQDSLATELGVSRQTINRVLAKPPFKRLVIRLKDYGRVTLIRLGAEQCTTDYQRILLSIWIKEILRFNAELAERLAVQIGELENDIFN